jgi:hypothetical protein
LLVTALALTYPALVVAGPELSPPAQRPTTDWIIWEMDMPLQNLL